MGNRYRRSGIVGPLILICLGGVFLLHNLDLITWSVWDVVFTLWPILFIAIGVDLLIGRRSTWGAVFAAIIILGLFVSALILLEPGGAIREDAAEIVRIGGVNVDEADISVEPSFAYLEIAAARPGGENLLEGRIVPRTGEQIFTESTVTGGTTVARVWSTGAIAFPFLGGWAAKPSWRIEVHPGVESEIQADLDIGKVDVDLERLEVNRISSNLGVGQNWVRLPLEGQVEGKVSAGLGEIRIFLPPGMEARIRATTGLGAVDVPEDFSRVGDLYFSPGYDGADNRADLSVDLGMGIIRIE